MAIMVLNVSSMKRPSSILKWMPLVLAFRPRRFLGTGFDLGYHFALASSSVGLIARNKNSVTFDPKRKGQIL